MTAEFLHDVINSGFTVTILLAILAVLYVYTYRKFAQTSKAGK